MEKINVVELAKALRGAGVPPSFGPDLSRLLIHLWRRLAEGHPVSRQEIAQIASHLGISRDVAFSLMSRTSEQDSAGNTVGLIGLSLKTHPHRFEIDNQLMSTWCAWDTLFLPSMLKRAANVESFCPKTKKKVQVTIAPGGVVQYNPSSAVVSIVIPKTTKEGTASVEELWMLFCHNVHFFSSPEAASEWLSEKKLDAEVLTVEEGYELGQMAFAELLGYA